MFFWRKKKRGSNKSKRGEAPKIVETRAHSEEETQQYLSQLNDEENLQDLETEAQRILSRAMSVGLTQSQIELICEPKDR